MSNNSRRIIPPLPGSISAPRSIEDKENLPRNYYNRTRIHRQIDKHKPIEKSVNGNDSTSSVSDTTDHSGNTLNSSCCSQQHRSILPLNLSLRHNPIINSSSRSGNRVLRSGETLERFFCIAENCKDEHRRLCENIVNNTDGAGNDLVKWREALEVASRAVNSLKIHTSKSEEGNNLIKLFKRAASRFPCCDGSTIQNISNKQNLLAVWLLYAKTQCRYGSRNDAHSIFQHIKNSRIGELQSNFYIELAIFEFGQKGCHLNGSKKDDEKTIRLERSIEIIETGIMLGSEPVNTLNKYLNKLFMLQGTVKQADEEGDRPTDMKLIDDKGQFRKIPVLPRSYNGVKLRARNLKRGGEHLNTSNGKQNEGSMTNEYASDKIFGKSNSIYNPPIAVKIDQSSASDKVSSTSVKQSQIANESCVDENNNKSILVHGKGLNNLKIPDYKRKKALSRRIHNDSDEIVQEIYDKSCASKRMVDPHYRAIETINSKKADQNKVAKFTDEENDHTGRTTVSTSSTTKRIFPRLSRNIKKLGGGAQRVCPDEIVINAPSPETSCDEKRARFNNTERTPPQIKKADIDYMLDWTPSGPRSKSTSKVDFCKDSVVAATSVAPTIIEKIGEGSTTKDSAPSSSSSLSRGSSDCGDKKTESISKRNAPSSFSSMSHHSDTSVQSTKKDDLDTKVSKHSPCISKILSNKSQSSSRPFSPGFTPNAYFLPIVSETNMITINSKPFLKLGVIGKGGSCKVYRALSKDRNIVGIKKVKLAGMSKKAISGYANEIALLKRLRGNPAIIQMHESEINLQQKAIYLVMELGEVDLNYVLQKQELRQTNGIGSLSPLNMNFIRLTWQQMLNAVYCIHEARIIHGDLKPANFLFVRGSLKLIDFGIAKAIQTEDTINIYRDNQVGTLNYMSPESIQDSGTGKNGLTVKCGRPSDVWSLGCILYQMCYKKTPFADLRMVQKINAIVDPGHEIKYPDTIDHAAISAMKSCLHRKPEDRALIVGDDGLLNQHHFLHFGSRQHQN